MEAIERYIGLLLSLEAMPEEERAAFFAELRARYCMACGRADSGCHCQNDE